LLEQHNDSFDFWSAIILDVLGKSLIMKLDPGNLFPRQLMHKNNLPLLKLIYIPIYGTRRTKCVDCWCLPWTVWMVCWRDIWASDHRLCLFRTWYYPIVSQINASHHQKWYYINWV